MKDEAEQVTDLVEKDVAFQERMKAEADKMATALIRTYLGPDHKVPSTWRASIRASAKR